MRRSPKVRVRKALSRWFASIASLGLGLGLGIAAAAQTSGPQGTSPQSAPTPATAPASAPSPTAEGQDKIESIRGYRQQSSIVQQPGGGATATGGSPAASAAQTNPQSNSQAGPQSYPIPQTAPAPVVAPAQPTPQVPYTALPGYGDTDHSDTEGSAYIPVDSWATWTRCTCRCGRIRGAARCT